MPEVFPKLTRRVTDRPLEPEICFAQAYSFPSMIKHLVTVHNLTLHPVIDFCTDCSTVITSSLFGVYHYLNKALNYQRNPISNDPTPIKCQECHRHFKAIELALKHFSSEIKFEDLLTEGYQPPENLETLFESQAGQEAEKSLDLDFAQSMEQIVDETLHLEEEGDRLLFPQ